MLKAVADVKSPSTSRHHHRQDRTDEHTPTLDNLNKEKELSWTLIIYLIFHHFLLGSPIKIHGISNKTFGYKSS